MKIETVALEDQQTKLIAEFDADTLEKYKHQAARKISQSQKFPGFRPGKAPYDMVRRVVGDEALQQEAIELMLDVVYPEVLKEANVNPAGPGKLEEIVKMDPPTFAFIVPLPPEVQLGDYKEIRKDYTPPEVTDEQVEVTVRRLQRSYGTAEPVERAAQKGDVVSFKLSAKRTQPAEGENETLVEETPYQMIAGEEDEDEPEAWPYKGFEDELVGMSVGETKTVTHIFSDESPFEDLRGKEATFTITVDGVKENHLPELNDEFAQSMGQFETMEELRKAIRAQLEQNNSQEYDQQYYDGLIDALVDQSTVKYPPFMLDEEIEDFISGLEKNLEREHLDLDTYLKMREMDRSTFVENEVKPAAKRRLERSLVLHEFSHEENVELKDEEVQSIYYSALQQLEKSGGANKPKNQRSTREMANTLAINTANSLFNQRLLLRLKAIATGKGDEAEQQPETEAQPEAEQTQAEPAAQETYPLESEAATETMESSAITSEQAAEEEQAVSENELAEEPPQADKETGESNPQNEA